MAVVRFINYEKYLKLWESAPELARKHIVRRFKTYGPKLAKYIKSNHRFKNRSGKLEGDISYKVYSSPYPILEVGVLDEQHPYGHFVHSGTSPHWITPVKAKSLRFFIGGKPVFAKKVLHPGTRPDPFVKNGVKKNMKNIVNEINQGVFDGVRELGLIDSLNI